MRRGKKSSRRGLGEPMKEKEEQQRLWSGGRDLIRMIFLSS